MRVPGNPLIKSTLWLDDVQLVERTFAWLNQFRRLRVRYEKWVDIHEAFLFLRVCSDLLASCESVGWRVETQLCPLSIDCRSLAP
jgi:transposase